MRFARTVLVARLILATPLAAQVDLSGYGLGMGSHSGRSALIPASTSLLGRGRLMALAGVGPFDLDVAYEHVVTRSSSGRGLALTSPGATGADDWLGADWELWSTDRSSWRHRLDRVSAGWSEGPVEVTIGRQAISWATTLFLTPADPFAPFDPSDPFRVYRAGVDAARVRVFPGPFTELEAVVRPTDTVEGTTTTALVRGQTSVGSWALGGWGGVLHDEAAAAVFATGAVGATALRTELSVRQAPTGGATLRGALGVDRYVSAAGRDASVLFELQYDGFGAATSSNLLQVIESKPFMRGEIQTLGRWTLAAQAAYQLHPLVGVDALALANADDGSALLAPGVIWSATGAASVRVGAFTGIGGGPTEGTGPVSEPGPLDSEYGIVPWIGYLSLTWFF